MKPFYSLHRAYAPFVFIGLFLLASFQDAHSQWLQWQNETSSRLVLSSVANSDDEEKDMWAADLNNDGHDDLIVVRKEPFSAPSEPPKSDLLLINVNGVLTDMTTLFAPEFISNPTFARDVYIGDFDADGWKDVIIANTFGDIPNYYSNQGEDASGNWLGLADETSTRFPQILDDGAFICAVWGGDVTGDGAPDIYFANYRPNGTGITAKDFLYINDGNGNFTEQAQSRLGNLRNSAFGTACQIVDMDNDGDNDIIKNTTLYSVAPWNALGTILMFNNGNGTFTNWQNLVPSGAPYMFDVADFNNDGKKDLYVVDDGSDRLLMSNVITANTNISFIATTVNFGSVNGFGGNVHAMDIDLDGDADIAVSDVDVDIPPCDSGRRLAILRNDNGVFTNPYGTTLFPWADNSYDMAWIDINEDGLPDFVTSKCSGYGVFMSDNCGLAPNPSDYDEDGLADTCDPCPTNPDPNCAPPTDYPTTSLDNSAARQWNELLLASIRKDFARPPVHARNLFHFSIAAYDSWAAYEESNCTFLLGQTIEGYTNTYSGIPPATNIENARATTMHYACYRLLRNRFANSPQAALLYQGYDAHMAALGLDINFTSSDYTTGDARALGNFIAESIIAFGLQDGSNQGNNYVNTTYAPVNPPMIVDDPGNPNVVDINKWQPTTLDIFIDQSGNEIPGATPAFIGAEWGSVTPFSLKAEDKTVHPRNGFNYEVYHDPGTPPLHAMDGGGTTPLFQWNYELVSVWSSHLDATDGVMWDISPASRGNQNTLPTNLQDHTTFYNLLNGGTAGSTGHATNPVTGQPYAPNMVPRADYARVLAEFWADGPDSETPPGHWFSIFNYVTDHPLTEKKFEGQGDLLNDLEWDVKGYLALGGAMHDVAITTWGIKGHYDYTRPVHAIRAMADLGQASDPLLPNYHPGGLHLIPNYIELVAAGDPLDGGGANVNKIKVKAWRGHDVINNVDTDEAGVGWILAENWFPFQRSSFVTPPFAGYTSGHSSYSRAAAEVLTRYTGDAYFPGGMGEFTALQNEYLVFEDGPSVDVHLQWATYRDAADESALSRIWGGIHPPADDIPSRLIGITVGNEAFDKAKALYSDDDNDGVCNYIDAPCEGNIELCNGIDDNCNGQVDEGFDLDADGYTTCEGDCDDNNAAINPDATEILCDDIDNNCNGTIDEGRVNGCTNATACNYNAAATCDDGSCTFAIPWYLDADGDTYYASTQTACTSPGAGWTANLPNGGSGDCNDSNAAINPAASEVCGNTTDDDCDGLTDEGCCPTLGAIASITGPSGACRSQTGVVFSIAPVTGATSYVWTLPTGATGISSTNSISLSFSSTYNTGNLCVKAVNACNETSQVCKSVAVFLVVPTSPGSISGGNTNACAGTSKVYSIAAVSTATSYLWTAPTNATITSGQGTTSVTVTFASNFGASGTLSVRAVNCKGNSALRTLIVYGKPGTPGAISGPANAVCGGTTQVYTIATVNGATSYNWTVPTGAVINSGQGSTSINVTFPAVFSSGIVGVSSVSSCGTSTPRNLTVYGASPLPASITGQTSNLCGGGTQTYTVPAVTGAISYNWTAPAGCTIVGNTGTSVTISIPSNFVSGTLCYTITNACGVSPTRCNSLRAAPDTPASITSVSSVCANAQNVVFSTAQISSYTYTWVVPTGCTIVSGQGTNSISVNWGTAAGNVLVRANNSCGSSSYRSKAISIITCFDQDNHTSELESISIATNEELKLNVYPNPNDGNFFITSDFDGEFSLQNELGQTIKQFALNQDNQFRFEIAHLSSGLYFIVGSVNGKLVTEKIIVAN
jgi:PKD-like domain/Putative metal-binding motif/FG-GAP-like repeat/Secretion system C-terminal sorting domain